MNLRAVKHNERWKALATFVDNIGLAFVVAGGAQLYSVKKIDDDVKMAAIGAVTSLVVAWTLRSRLKPED